MKYHESYNLCFIGVLGGIENQSSDSQVTQRCIIKEQSKRLIYI